MTDEFAEAAHDAMFGALDPHEAEMWDALNAMRAEKEAAQAEVPAVTLTTLATEPVWVAWQQQSGKGGRVTKLPYNAVPGKGGMASSTDPETWGSRAQAEQRAATLPKPFGLGGIGLVFSDLGNGWSTGGIDLDSCRCPESGEIEPWAKAVIEKLASYAEVSPSSSGVKSFFLYQTDDLDDLRAAMGGGYGKKWAWRGKDHPPAIEMYLARRFFATTNKTLDGCSSELRRIPTDVLLDLIYVTAPEFVTAGLTADEAKAAADAEAKAEAKAEKKAKTAEERERRKAERGKTNDRSRSAIAFAKGKALRRAGATFEEMAKALAEDPETAEWTREKGQSAGQRELRRIWDKAVATGPIIKVEPGEVDKAATEAEAALIAAGLPIYQRGMDLVRPISLAVPASKGRVVNVACLGTMDVDGLIDRMCPSAEFVQYDARADDYVRINPPALVARLLLSRAGHWHFPGISGVITTPTLRPDGSVLFEPGYDPITRLYHVADPDLTLPPIPDKPTKADAHRCLNLLVELLVEFPFVNKVSQSVSLSAILTAVNRAAMSVAPLHLFRAHTPGTGKSFLADVVSTIATGRECPVVAASSNKEEAEKRLAALMRAGVPLISLDNVNGEIGSNLLAQAVERPIVQIRRFNTLDTDEVANTATYLATGNNAFLRDDVVRRGIIGELDAGMERPELREFKGNPVKIILANRGLYVAACLGIVRAYLAAGMPDAPRPLASFEDWSNLVRGALIWLGCADPCISQEGARDEDPGLGEMQEMMAALNERFPNGAFTTAAIKSRADLRNVSDTGSSGEYAYPDFRDLLLRMFGERGEVNTQRLGNWLREKKGRIVGGRRLKEHHEKAHGGKKQWFIEKV